MSQTKYYEQYWKSGTQDGTGHVVNTPQWPIEELNLFFNSIKNFIGKKILDIGAGEGVLMEYLQNKLLDRSSIAGLEISSNAIKIAHERNKRLKIYQGSAEEKYPFKDSQFDTIFMTDVIEHLVDIDSLLKECKRVLSKKGNIIIITPDYNLLKKIVISTFYWEKFFYPTNPHIRFFTKKSMDAVMVANGFKPKYYRWGITWFGIMPQNSYYVYGKK